MQSSEMQWLGLLQVDACKVARSENWMFIFSFNACKVVLTRVNTMSCEESLNNC